MPAPTCERCGGQTNSTVSDYWDQLRVAGKARATVCYAKHDGKRWVKGCAFDMVKKCDESWKVDFAESIIKDDENKGD